MSFLHIYIICSCCIWLMMFKGTNEDVKEDKSWMCTFLHLDQFTGPASSDVCLGWHSALKTSNGGLRLEVFQKKISNKIQRKKYFYYTKQSDWYFVLKWAKAKLSVSNIFLGYRKTFIIPALHEYNGTIRLTAHVCIMISVCFRVVTSLVVWNGCFPFFKCVALTASGNAQISSEHSLWWFWGNLRNYQ